MRQATLFGDIEDLAVHIVNVASVPQLSPFRYPGGKTWLVPHIRRWLSAPRHAQRHGAPSDPLHFVEPFVGGGSISLAVASERLADDVTMVELDADVAAVWQSVLDVDDVEWLAQAILEYPLTLENVQMLLSAEPLDVRERAFQTIVKNRVCHGGKLAPGAGLLNVGENGRGIRSRWYPETLVRRIRSINTMRSRIHFSLGDGLQTIADNAHDPHTAFFIDPPYTAGATGKRAGKRLYRYNEIDHERLFALANTLRGDFLMTYDDADEVRSLAMRYHFDTRLVPMKNTHHAKMMELLIGRNLEWVSATNTTR